MKPILGLLLSCIILNAYAQNDACESRHCLSIVDAGSTGSRLHTYAYDLDNNHYPIHINEIWVKKIKPGLSALDLNESTINDYLTRLLDDAPQKKMPIYFYSTAGMRLLSNAKQQLANETIRHWFDENQQWSLMEAKTINGQEEGVYGWLAINYQLGNFDDTNSAKHIPVGVLDIGGSSVQVTFPVTNMGGINKADLYSVDAGGHHFVLFAHSFLGLGQTLVSQQFFDKKSCFADGYQLPNNGVGKGDAAGCQRDISQLINNVHGVNPIVNRPLAQNPMESWYAIGGVSSFVDDPIFSAENGQFTNRDLREQVDTKICHQLWQDVSAQYPDNDFLYEYCLLSAYYYALMVDGYGLKAEQTIHYIASGQGADWTMGVVLHQQGHS